MCAIAFNNKEACIFTAFQKSPYHPKPPNAQNSYHRVKGTDIPRQRFPGKLNQKQGLPFTRFSNLTGKPQCPGSGEQVFGRSSYADWAVRLDRPGSHRL